MKDASIKIFNAWQNGEAGNGYDDFKNRLDVENFIHFSHPLMGNYAGIDGLVKLQALVAERELKPNNLRFSNTLTYGKGNAFCFQFDSEGTLTGGIPYKGFNIIQLEIKNNKLIAFREYFGFFNPDWFK